MLGFSALLMGTTALTPVASIDDYGGYVSLLWQPTSADVSALAAIDYSVYGHVLTKNSVTFSTSSPNAGYGSAVFNGTSSSITIPASRSLYLDGDFDIVADVWWDGTAALYQNIVGSGGGSFTGNAAFFRVWGTGAGSGLAGKVGIGNPTHDATSAVYSSSTLTSGTWNRVRATRTSGIIRLRINDVLVATGGTDNSVYDFSLGGTAIGRSPWDGANGYFSGKIASVRIDKGVARTSVSATGALLLPDAQTEIASLTATSYAGSSTQRSGGSTLTINSPLPFGYADNTADSGWFWDYVAGARKLKIDMGSAKRLARVRFWSVWSGGSRGANLTIRGSNDNVSFTDIRTIAYSTNSAEAYDYAVTASKAATTAYRYYEVEHVGVITTHMPNTSTVRWWEWV